MVAGEEAGSASLEVCIQFEGGAHIRVQAYAGRAGVPPYCSVFGDKHATLSLVMNAISPEPTSLPSHGIWRYSRRTCLAALGFP